MGTLIMEDRDTKDAFMTSIALKPGITFLHQVCVVDASHNIETSQHLRRKTLFACYCRKAGGTLIREGRDMKDALMISIVLKPGITLLDIVSTRMLGQVGFMATVFDIFNSNGISVDVVATSEVSISLTLDPRCVSCCLLVV